MTGWIPVGERVPEHRYEVWCWFNQGAPGLAWWDGAKWHKNSWHQWAGFMDENHLMWLENEEAARPPIVTHWAELPRERP